MLVGETQQEDMPSELPIGIELSLTLRGHRASIGRIAWSSDGVRLASPSSDKTVKLWNVSTGNCEHTFEGHKAEAICAAFSPTCKHIACGYNDGTVLIWSVSTYELLIEMAGEGARANILTYHPSGDYLTVGYDNGNVIIWAIPDGAIAYKLNGHKSKITSLAYSRSGKFIATTSWESQNQGQIKLWDVDQGKLLRIINAHERVIFSLAFSQDDEVLASASQDYSIKIWNPITGNLKRTLEGHLNPVTSISFSSDGNIIASFGEDTIRFWNYTSGKCITTIPEQKGHSWYASISFHPNQPLIASVGSDPQTRSDERDQLIHIWRFDLTLLGCSAPSSIFLRFEEMLHPVIIDSSLELFENGHFREAVLNSITAVFDLIRQKSGVKDDGDRLIGQVFSLENPILIFSELSSESGKNDQKGFLQIFKGAYQGIRNPKAHTLTHDLTLQKAAEYLVFASLLARRVTEARNA